ncbi:hypothetical protein Tco_0838930 [Tanacetum coccineum]|uniref:Uncharacterized protein n=1 Tax=Tanacetum coccineum TaxID=301880 RepID=A0ABQ5AT81_9ASTR
MAATPTRRRRRKNITTTELPVDVIFNNILPRLPARYSHRSKRLYIRIKLWSMERIGVWEEASTYKYRRVQDIHLLEPLHLMRDENWLMKPEDSRKYYSKVDLETKYNEGGSCFYKLQGFVAGVYIESFVSPNQYMN